MYGHRRRHVGRYRYNFEGLDENFDDPNFTIIKGDIEDITHYDHRRENCGLIVMNLPKS